jgi:exopolysaccharide biosynthesis polyprenyl glycosylphosphotransferase
MRPRRVLIVLDALSAFLAVFAMYALMRWRGTRHEHEEVALLIAALVILGALVAMVGSGQYSDRRRLSRLADVGKLANALILAGACTLVLNFVTKGFFTGVTAPSRLALGLFFVTFFVLGVASRFVLCAVQRRSFAKGHALRTLLLLGEGPTAEDFCEFVNNRPWLGVKIAGRISSLPGKPLRYPDSSPSAVEHPGLAALPVVGTLTNDLEGLRELDRAMVSTGAQELVVALEPEDEMWLHHVARLLSLVHVPFKIVPSLFEQSYRATELLGYAELPVIDVEVDPLDRVSRLTKRVLDLATSAVLLVLLLPLELLIAAAIVLESGLPVIYKQERVGRHGRRFQIYKFRTMVKNADELRAALENENEAGDGGQLFKMRSDPRVTRVGAILRKFSLDELPQLINVVKKEMSLVGPRPPLPGEVEKYEQEHLIRLRGEPGVTGLWQVSGRSDLSFDDMVRLDRYYLDNWSLRLDLTILLRTFMVVLRRDGAY